LPSPSGRGQGEGLSICIDLRPSPAAPRRPLPEGEVMLRMYAPRATFCEKSPSLKFCPALVRQQPLQPTFAFGTTLSLSRHRTRAEARDYMSFIDPALSLLGSLLLSFASLGRFMLSVFCGLLRLLHFLRVYRAAGLRRRRSRFLQDRRRTRHAAMLRAALSLGLQTGASVSHKNYQTVC